MARTHAFVQSIVRFTAKIDFSAAWNGLQNLDFTAPVKDFVSSIKDKTLAKDILSAEDKVSELLDEFCEPAKFTPSKKVKCAFPWTAQTGVICSLYVHVCTQAPDLDL